MSDVTEIEKQSPPASDSDNSDRAPPHSDDDGRRGTTLRVALIGRSRFWRRGLALTLASDGGSVACLEYDSAADLAATRPDGEDAHVSVLIGRCRDPQSLRQLEALVKIERSTPAVVYCQCCRPDPPTLRAYLDRGARGLILPTTTPRAALAVVELVAQGGVYLPPPLAASLPWPPQSTASSSGATAPHTLSARETNVLALLGQSLSNQEIAHRLGISEGTVKVHLRNLRRKTLTRSRVALALIAAPAGPR